MKYLKHILKPLSFIPALIVMYMIFSFSAQDSAASANLSYKVTYDAVKIVDKTLDLELTESQITKCINKIHAFVRKCGHFSEYCLLAITLAIPLYVYGVRGIWLFITIGAICVVYASTDEFHQRFVSGRGPSVKDVLIDSSGAMLGILFVKLFGHITRKVFRCFS
jgi:VanZ family protein